MASVEPEELRRLLCGARLGELKLIKPRTGSRKWFKVVYVPPEVVPPDEPHYRVIVELPDGRRALLVVPARGGGGDGE